MLRDTYIFPFRYQIYTPSGTLVSVVEVVVVGCCVAIVVAFVAVEDEWLGVLKEMFVVRVVD